LPPGGQDQARTHRLSHRTTSAHRGGDRHTRKTSAHRILPVLWRADENGAEPDALMER
jgi:hypothetical protein